MPKFHINRTYMGFTIGLKVWQSLMANSSRGVANSSLVVALIVLKMHPVLIYSFIQTRFEKRIKLRR